MNIAVITAGGKGIRMSNGDLPKQFMEINGLPIIVHTINVFQNNDNIDAIIIVCIKEYIDYMKELIDRFSLTKVAKVVEGGETGQQSIYNGLLGVAELYDDLNDILVLIHDGVRPLIDNSIIDKNIDIANKYGNCITIKPCAETIVTIDSEVIVNVLNRDECYVGQAPQTFRFKDLINAHKKCPKTETFIDSAHLMKRMGYKLFTAIGPDNNIKITTPIDLYLFQTINSLIKQK